MSLATSTVRRDLAEILGIPLAELDEDASLADQGLDSLRMMTLVETWRAAGARVDFADLAPLPTLRDWLDAVCTDG